jgi:hypothetical protein
MHRSLGLALLLTVGCGGDPLAGDVTDMANPGPYDLLPLKPDLHLPRRPWTDHPQLPQVDNLGGPVLANAEITTIVWPGDEAVGERVDQFHRWMLGSTYWTQSLGEYGVNAGVAKGLVVMSTPPPKTIDDSQFPTIIRGLISSGAVSAPNKNTLLAFVIPQATASTLYGSKGCVDYGGYHAETRASTGSAAYVSYAVNLQCVGFSSGTLFDSLTDVLSHEAGEAATDPHPFTRPTYVNQTIPTGGEVGDLCVGLEITEHASIEVPDAGTVAENYVVTRLYSQAAAADGDRDPCVPTLGKPYFNVGIDPPQIMITADSSGKATLLGKVEPYAYGDVGLIKWAFEGTPSSIKITPTEGQGIAGDTFYFKIEVTNAQQGTYPLTLFTQSAKGGFNEWWSTITIQ